jgi:hypothetical protein
MSRLKDFSQIYYLSQFSVKKDEIFGKFRVGFLNAFIASGMPVGYLQEISGNSEEIRRLSRTTVSFHSDTLAPLSKKSGMDPENAKIYADIENRLRTKLNNTGSELLEEFFHSEYFTSLPGLYSEARRMIKDAASKLTEVVDSYKRFSAEIYLDMIGDPDEELALEAAQELTAQSAFQHCLASIALAMEKNDEDGTEEAIKQLFDKLFSAVKGLAGGSGAEKYMEWLSNTCQI